MTGEPPTARPAAALRILVGDRALHVPLDAVEAVVRTPRITAVPGTPPALAGLFNHQGAVYAAVHPVDGRGSTERHAVVVRSRRHGRFALLCDWAEDLAEPPEGEPCLDLDALAEGVVAAYRDVEPALPLGRGAPPRAVIRLRRSGPAAPPPAP